MALRGMATAMLGRAQSLALAVLNCPKNGRLSDSKPITAIDLTQQFACVLARAVHRKSDSCVAATHWRLITFDGVISTIGAAGRGSAGACRMTIWMPGCGTFDGLVTSLSANCSSVLIA